jgi:iron complex transport system ATP-binding protein
MHAPAEKSAFVLSAAGLSVRRGDRALLEDASLALAPGRVTAVIGPNGAGKSTLLRAITGDLRPDAGSVSFLGRPLADWPVAELARHRAVLPQESDLSFPFRVEEVVRLGRIPHPGGGDSSHDKIVALDCLRQVDLSALADRVYPTLSGGEKQRVHLARALAQLRPAPGVPTPAARALLLDEPTASLDLSHQHAVLALARELALREGVAVLAILHDLNLVLSYADDLVVLRRGRVVASGPAATTLTPALIQDVFAVRAVLHPANGGHAPHLSFPPACDIENATS